ncbi:unnamed protein product [Symbiodinium natans]|uniref:Uncharacterized protein n=1 Tax=Symbiodinium natans TaxID=878477 RepID=A0A812I156_9DINO|nr:unnamed protein product [Symbiodinium natans]
MGLLRYADIYGWTSAISSSSCAGEWEGALEVLTAACYSRLQPTLVTFNALAGASADLDSSFAFPWLVGLTVLERGQADAKTYSSLISSVTCGRTWREASEVWDRAVTSRVEVDVVLHGAAVASLAAGLQWQRALEDAAAIVKRRVFSMSGAVASTVLGSCFPNWQVGDCA